MTDYISLAGFILTVFVFGVTVGKLVEKIERFISKKEDVRHKSNRVGGGD